MDRRSGELELIIMSLMLNIKILRFLVIHFLYFGLQKLQVVHKLKVSLQGTNVLNMVHHLHLSLPFVLHSSAAFELFCPLYFKGSFLSVLVS